MNISVKTGLLAVTVIGVIAMAYATGRTRISSPELRGSQIAGQ